MSSILEVIVTENDINDLVYKYRTIRTFTEVRTFYSKLIENARFEMMKFKTEIFVFFLIFLLCISIFLFNVKLKKSNIIYRRLTLMY